MEELRCVCGHLILDGPERLLYKGAVMPDAMSDDFHAWVVRETMTYVHAVVRGEDADWLSARGYPASFGNALSAGVVLAEHLQGQFAALTRRVFECENCGRVHVESGPDRRFVSFSPDSGKFNALLATEACVH